MAATITVTPASGSITAKKTVCTFAISGADKNDTGNFSTTIYPTSPEFRYVMTMVVGGAEVGRTQVFGVTPDGAFQFNSYIFPVAGTYTVQLYDVTDPTSPAAVQTAATIVVAA
jgi:hypothetical protein